MIKMNNGVFHISTENTSYIFRVTKHGDLEHLYYGEKIDFQNDYEAFFQERSMLLVSTLYPDGDISYGIDDMCFEYSAFSAGDMRESAHLITADSNICKFKYSDFAFVDKIENNPNASAYGADKILKITMKDEFSDALLDLYYCVFEKCDIITRCSAVHSESGELTVEKLMSAQIDFDRDDMKMITFDGAWSRERYKHERLLSNGKFVSDSISGASSARHNPFVMLADKNADSFHGDCFAFNLIYSGNHYEAAEVCPYSKTRFLSGISTTAFSHKLNAKEQFITPECVMTYSSEGYNKASQNMHRFVKEHIVRGYWKNRAKPVLLNSWEAMYFDITEEKIQRLADKACDIGAELLVVDDGWFGKRNDDTTSLGDWIVNKDKFPEGMSGISDYVHSKGLLFGLWFEPEMISEKSELYSKHPDWALGRRSAGEILGRGQLILDLSRKDVQDFIIDSISNIINEVKIDYIKWDFNRLFGDFFSHSTALFEVQHKYVLGLYRILSQLTEKHPKVLFELCASGGTRFDLGMLCYMPVGWVSDNTDVYSRVNIQEGTSYAYPPTVMCNHISACPNHQTKRVTKLKDRFSTAAFGVMGMQYDLTKMTDEEFAEVKGYVAQYKEMRKIIDNASFYRLNDGFDSNFNTWMLVSDDKKTAYVFLFRKLFQPVTPLPRIKLAGLDKEKTYVISELNKKAIGEVLMKHGIIPPQNYQGNEISQNGSMLTDFSATIYKLEEK